MYDFNNYDNDLAYDDDYGMENEDAYEDYLIQKQLDEKAEEFNSLEYQSKMAEQLINDINDKM